MRTLFFVSEYDRYNGAQRSLRQLLIELPKNNINPIVVFPAEGKCVVAYRGSGINCVIIPPPKVLMQFGKHLLDMGLICKLWIFFTAIIPYSFRLNQFMNKSGINVLHCNTSRSLLLASPIPWLVRKRIIWHVRGELHGLSSLLKKVCEKLATSIWLVASSLQNQINKKSLTKVVTIYNGVSKDSVRSINVDKNNEVFTFCTFAAVTPFKGYHHLINAIHEVNKITRKKVRFLSIGELFDAEYVDFLNKKIIELNINNFEFKGWQDDPFDYYAQADVVLLPTVVDENLKLGGKNIRVRTGEGLPRTILEAMFLEKLIIATRVAGSPEQIIDGESGFLVEASNSKEMAKVILHVLNMTEDQRGSMAKKAKQRADEVFDASKLSAFAAQKIFELA